jgi:hypothetical protein
VTTSLSANRRAACDVVRRSTPKYETVLEQIPEYKANLEKAIGAREAARLGETIAPKMAAFNAAARLINDNLCGIVAKAPRKERV